ncbi:MAG: galactokinase [Oscillospiraceae bacterium]
MIKSIEQTYGAGAVDFQKARYDSLRDEFEELYGEKPERFFSAPGRTEICGNHTDHNKGKVLAAGVSLDVIAGASATDDNVIYLTSEGFGTEKVDLNNLDVNTEEYGSSRALIKGVAAGLKERRYKIGGFKAYTKSNVLKGSGLSSSAAFEVLICTILSGLYNEGEIDAVTAAKVSQYAENKFFGKPSGLMDQMACSVGGLIYIDFKDEQNPIIKKIEYDFNSCGHSLCIVDTKGNHADLTPEYAAIPTEMKAIAGYFGKDNLRELSKEEVMENARELREKSGDRAVLRALHFFDENDRVDAAASALENNDFESFAKYLKASGDSSYKYLQNVFASSSPQEQGLSTALYMAEDILEKRGAYRVHGGGFAGTIQAFVPEDLLEKFKNRMESIFGAGACHIMSIRPFGGAEISLF